MNFGCQAEVFQLSHHRQYLFVIRHPIWTQPNSRTHPKTLPTLPHAIFSTLQGTQNPDTKPTLQRAKNTNALPTDPG